MCSGGPYIILCGPYMSIHRSYMITSGPCLIRYAIYHHWWAICFYGRQSMDGQWRAPSKAIKPREQQKPFQIPFVFEFHFIQRERNQVWGSLEQIRICCQFEFLGQIMETDLKQCWAEYNRCFTKSWRRIKKNCFEEAQTSVQWMFDQVLIENERKLLLGSPEQILIDVQLNANEKWKATALRQPIADSS